MNRSDPLVQTLRDVVYIICPGVLTFLLMSNDDGYIPWARQSRNLPTRSMTTAPSSSRRYTSPEAPNRPQSLSYRQLLQQRLQKYQWTAMYHVEMTGPQHDQRWSGSFWLGGTKIGQSSFYTTKDAAKEDAAKASLNWLNTYGYH
ncbi:hypothetical protein FRC18_005967 [Serendipita sp. 400]|nr:hypothetical protein FRC18_005967 [Serendipita sp. 400]